MILVTGASGYVGRAVVADLASRGRDVVAMVRDAKAVCGRLPPGVAPRVADYEDRAALKKAFAGVDELVLISSDGEAGTVMRHHANAIDAAVAARIRHITFTSIIDVEPLSPFYLAPGYRDAERRLADSGVTSTILRCGLYSDFILDHWLLPGRASGELALPVGNGQVAPISRADLAAAVAAVAAEPEKPDGVLTITGGRALGFAEIAARYAEITGKPLAYRACSDEDYLAMASIRLEGPWPEAFSTLCASIAEGRYGHATNDFMAVTGREPESFRDFLLRANRE
jgi:NAD(P)H dehydrogenase (quinone)